VACCFLAVAPTLLLGLGGSVTTSRYPAAWAAADRTMGAGSGLVLFLPWHAYQPFEFTGQRTVATPASAYFRRPVLSSDAVELGELRTSSVSQRSAYLDRLVAAGGGGRFGRLVAPLGVEYVALATDREAAAYGWLDHQVDLRPVLRTSQLVLFRVEAYGTGRVGSARSATTGTAIELAAAGALGTEAVLPSAVLPSGVLPRAVLPSGPVEGNVPSAADGYLRRISSTRWLVEAGPPGWVVLPEEWSSGWRAAGHRGRPTTAGTVAVRVGAGAVTIEYLPWRWLRLGVVISVLSLLALLVAGIVEHHGEWADWLASYHLTQRRPHPPERSERRRSAG
jgi:hypothetical protein